MQTEMLEKIARRIDRRTPGDFVLADVYGKGWDGLYVGDKVRIGRDFLSHVRAGDLPGVADSLRKDDRGHVYVKRVPVRG